MDHAEKKAFKHRLKRWALDLLGQRIMAAREAIDQAQQAANQEEKSSAGDKYETGRAMGHLRKDMHSRQLAEYVKELASLHAVNTDSLYEEGAAGAFVRTLQQTDPARPGAIDFFIVAGLGKQKIDDQTVLFLSPQAPLAKLLQNKVAGEDILFNGKPTRIIEIF